MDEVITNAITKLGGRKFILCVVTELLTAGLLWFGKLDQGGYTTVTLAIIGAYIAGNVMQKVQTTPAVK